MMDIYNIINLSKDSKHFTHFYILFFKKEVSDNKPFSFEINLRKTLNLNPSTKVETESKDEQVIMEVVSNSELKPNYFWFTSGKKNEQQLYYLFVTEKLNIDEQWDNYIVKDFIIDDLFRSYFFNLLLSEKINQFNFATRNAIYL